jgi:glycosyltransferase involved in cell wall biosynthesis
MQKVSIVTINYNNAAGLQRTIESVASQTYQALELIVIDGASTDGSLSVIEEYSKHIHFQVSEKDGGIFDAQNKGLQKATGDYVLVLNSGDELQQPDTLANIFQVQRTEQIIYGNMTIVHPDGKRESGKMPAHITVEHMMNDTLWHPVSFVKRTFLHEVGLYDPAYKIIADYEWFLRAIFTHHATLKYIDLPVAVFYLGGLSSLPENAEKIRKERVIAQKSVFGEEAVNAFYEKKNKEESSIIRRFIKRLKR